MINLVLFRSNPQHHIVLGIHTLGKESLLEDIAKSLNECILVSQKRFEQLQILERPDFYTTDRGNSRIEVINCALVSCLYVLNL